MTRDKRKLINNLKDYLQTRINQDLEMADEFDESADERIEITAGEMMGNECRSRVNAYREILNLLLVYNEDIH